MDRKLLLVDDEAAILSSLQRQLRHEGYEVLKASSGPQALELLKQQHIPVIVSDQRMPGMSGSEFLALAKELHPDSVRMILSGHSDYQDLSDAINQGEIFKFLAKPWSKHDLLKNINLAFEKYENSYILKPKNSEKFLAKKAFLEVLTQAIFNNQINHVPIAVIIIGLEDLSYVSYALGDEHRDKLLLKISQRLETLLDSPASICQLSEGEWALAFKDEDKDTVISEYIERLKVYLTKPVSFEHSDYSPKIKLGISNYHSGIQSADILFKQAYIAKRNAENNRDHCYFFYSPDMEECIERRWSLEQDLAAAVQKNAIDIYVQPKQQVHTGKVLGGELLLRWDHPQHGKISPEEFIPICEKSSLIFELDKMIIENAIKTIHAWQNKHEQAIPLSFNLSGKEFCNYSIVTMIELLLKQYTISPHLLEVEVTEGFLIENLQAAEQILLGLNRLGVKIVLDDFGTGYASLNYLTQLPFDSIKIDQNFIRVATINNRARTILFAIIEFCKKLNIKTIVKGVETEAQLDLIKSTQCDFIQGFILSEAIMLDEFEKKFIV